MSSSFSDELFVDTTSVQALLNSSVTYDFNDFNFQFTFKIKPEFENQIQKVNVDGSQVPTCITAMLKLPRRCLLPLEMPKIKIKIIFFKKKIS